TMQEPTLRAVPERATAPAPDSGMRYNRPMEDAARASAHEEAAAAGTREQLAAGSAAREQVADADTKVDTRNWITKKYTATYFGPERRKAANQTPYQGAE